MLIKVNRKIFCLLLFGVLFVALFGFLPYNKIKSTISQSANSTFISNTILIDAGHGGIDPGAIGINGCDEKDINLNIAITLKDILIANGYNVIMTRDTDISMHDNNYKKISQIKTSDLKNRLKIINNNENAISIMIHQNHFTEEKYNGAQMFYGRINPQSKLLAESFCKSFKENLQPDNERQIKCSTKDVYMLHNAKGPIVMAECGFLSNSAESKLLCNEEYQKKVAFTLFCGIENYKKAIDNN